MTDLVLQVWAHGTSTVGSGAEAKPGARNVPVSIGGVTVSPVCFQLSYLHYI